MKNKFDVRLNYRCIRPVLLVPCKQIKEGLVSRLPFLKAEKIVVAHTVKSPAPASPGTVGRPLNIVVTSQLNADKGHGTLLQALRLVLDKGLDFRFHIVGTGSEEAALKKQAGDLGLKEKIVWHGFQTDVRSLVGQCDIFVLPSFSEGFSNSLLEAMAEGLICISRDVGGVREIWFDTETSLLPASAGPRDFASALTPVLELSGQDVLGRKKNLYRRYCHWVKQKERETSWSDVFRYCLDLYTGKKARRGGRA
jgi:glycosyltransferase involved in cell wall biosynthesis